MTDLTFDQPIPDVTNFGSVTSQTDYGQTASDGTPASGVAAADHTHGTVDHDDFTNLTGIEIVARARSVRRDDLIAAASNTAPLAVFHRGLPRSAPENTRAAFRAAITAGAKVFETDIVWSSDGVPMILHDTTIERTVNTLSGSASIFSVAQLAKCDNTSSYNPNWSPVEGLISLYDLLHEFGGKVFMILEIKVGYQGESHATSASRVADIIHEYGLEDYTAIASFNDLTTSTSWTTYGIPTLRYSGGAGSDGSIGGVSATTLVAAGCKYVGLDFTDPNLATAADAWEAAGGKVFVYTVPSRYDRDIALAKSTGIIGVLSNDSLYMRVPNIPDRDVGEATNVDTVAIPAGVIPYWNTGTAKAELTTSEAEDLIAGHSYGIGWDSYGTTDNQRCLVMGRLGWGAGGTGKISAIMTMDTLPSDMTRWGGLGVWSDDRGHVSGGGTNTGVGYELVVRGNGDLQMYRLNADGSETSLGTAAGADLVADTPYTITLEVTATHVIGTANGQTIDVVDSTFRSLTSCGLMRSRANVFFNTIKRIS